MEGIDKYLSLMWRRGQVFLSILKTKISGKRKPVIVHLYPTYKCNLRCSYCLVDKDVEVKEMNTEQLLKLVDKLADMGTKMIVFLGGEFSILKDIEKVIDYIISRGIICNAVTNAILLPKKIEMFKKLDSICISMDGLGDSNDITRGKGTSQKILKSIELARKNGMAIRINCVVTKHNLNTYHELLEWAKNENILVTFGMPFEEEIKDMLLNEQEMRTFYQDLKRLKKEGYPILFSDETITYMENYPGSPADFIIQSQKKDKNIHKRYKKKCPYGRFIAYIHPDGMMLPCNNLYKTRNKGPNVLEVGVKQAWESIGSLDCLCCSEAGIPEWNFITSFRGMWQGAFITFRQAIKHRKT